VFCTIFDTIAEKGKIVLPTETKLPIPWPADETAFNAFAAAEREGTIQIEFERVYPDSQVWQVL